MHTVFMNTSETYHEEGYRGLIFKKLLTDNRLIMQHDYVPLNSLENESLALARLIDKEGAIREEFRVVVFFENEELKSGSRNIKAAVANATENLMSIKAEFALRVLHEKGKWPGEVLFIFGEKDERDFVADVPYCQAQNSTYWNQVALPAPEDVAAFLNEGKEMDLQTLIAFLQKCGADNKLINEKDACYALMTETLARYLLEMHRNRRACSAQEVVQLASEMVKACQEDRNLYFRRKNKECQFGYAYLPLEFDDSKEINRSLCRLMLCVHACANAPDTMAKDVFAGNGGQDTGKTLEKAFCVPQMDLKVLNAVLQNQLYYCRKPSIMGALPPRELSEDLKKADNTGADIIVSDHQPPELIEEFDFHNTMTVRGLQNAVNETLENIRDKNKNNGIRIREYLNRVESEYARKKDYALHEVRVTEKDYERFSQTLVVSGEGYDENKRIDDLENFECELEKLQNDAELNLLDYTGKIIPTEDFDETVNHTKHQTDAIFSRLKHDLALLLVCAGFVLAVVIPYVVLRKDLFRSLLGVICFGVTFAAAAAIVYGSYWLLVKKFKKEIVRLMQDLCEAFEASQRNNKECLEAYRVFLYNKVPRLFGLSRYEEILQDYRRKMSLRQEKLTFHKMSLHDRAANLKALINQLDISEEMPESFNENVPLLNPEEGLCENEAYYCFTESMVHYILGLNNEERTL